MGGKLGTILARAGHEVIISYSRHPGKLERLAREAGGLARAGTPLEAAEVLLLAVHWSRVDDVLKQAACFLDRDRTRRGRTGLRSGAWE